LTVTLMKVTMAAGEHRKAVGISVMARSSPSSLCARRQARAAGDGCSRLAMVRVVMNGGGDGLADDRRLPSFSPDDGASSEQPCCSLLLRPSAADLGPLDEATPVAT
ncbi:hypothetical protein Dimus_005134, partial [Dionaea muscipula]